MRCFGCQKQGGYLCHQCQNRLLQPNLLSLPKETICLYLYQPALMKFLTELKYRFAKETSLCLKQVIKHGLCRFRKVVCYWQENGFVIVPIPLSQKRLFWRGFNQSELIANSLAKIIRLEVYPELIKKTKETKQQSLLSLKQRKKNVKSAFATARNATIPRNIILIDDVYTSGETAKECRKTLLMAGANSVWIMTLLIKRSY